MKHKLAVMLGRLRTLSETTWLIAAAGGVYFVSQLAIGSILQQVGVSKALALQITLSSDTFRAVASELIATGKIAAYYRHFYLDFFHPIWYAAFLSLFAARMFNANNVSDRFNFLLLAPFVAGACDLGENIMHLYFLHDLRNATPALVAFSGTMTNTKWTLAFLCVATIIALAGRRLFRRRGGES